jgi:hypothetical protein
MGQTATLRPLKLLSKQTGETAIAKQMAEIYALRKRLIAAEARSKPDRVVRSLDVKIRP